MTLRNRKEDLNEIDNDSVNEKDDSSKNILEHAINRPPKPPGPALGPYFQFLTTDLDNMKWIGSVLIFRHISFNQPEMEFISDAKVKYDWEILYENLFDMRAYRINLFIELRPGGGDEIVQWKINWGDCSTNGLFHIARLEQKWRGGFFSCNGFDATIPKEIAEGLNYDHVWNHLNSIHEQSPLHLLLWGGDQSYNDFVIEDIPFLQDWALLPWEEKWIHKLTDDAKREIEQYYFYTYAEHWDRRPEMKRALGSVPSLMQWDDHDIFDGAGSYPALLQQSPIMTGLFELAQKMRLLFQHHTTLDKARKHRLFGYQGHNYLARCGPNLMILGTDGRTERTAKTVQHDNTWDIIFDKLDKPVDDVKHLIVLFPVPFSFVRFKLFESVLERFKNIALKWHNIPLLKNTNSVFGLPEPYDDLLDEWAHNDHIEERNRTLQRFQHISQKNKVRITFFSGDVHCCGVSRFQTLERSYLSPINDSKLMYQIISSAIVNKPPPRIFIMSAHFFGTKWYPVDNTEEELIDFFQRMPENSSRLFLKKLLPNRNWCYFEQCGDITATTTNFVQRNIFHRIWFYIQFLFLFLGIGYLFRWFKIGRKNTEIRQKLRGDPYHQRIETDQKQDEFNNLKVRFWLESTQDSEEDPTFGSYDLFIPSLK